MYITVGKKKVYAGGEAADLAEVKAKAMQALRDNMGKPIEYGPSIRNRRSVPICFAPQVESFMNRWDGFDPWGVWNQYVIRDIADSSGRADKMEKFYAKTNRRDWKES